MFCCRIVLFLIVAMKQRSDSVYWIFLPSPQKFVAQSFTKGGWNCMSLMKNLCIKFKSMCPSHDWKS